MSRNQPVDWVRTGSPVAYAAAVAVMETRVAAIAAGQARELVWLLEHPPLYTAGTSAKPQDLLNPLGLPVHASGRGGQYTYHGPGQRIAYAMLDLRQRGPNPRAPDLKAYVTALEDWLIASLARLGVTGERRRDRIGVWVDRGGGREAKIAALGIRVRRWITLHGVSLNVAPDLAHFDGIVPCGIREHGVTSLADLGKPAAMLDVDTILRQVFEARLGPSADAHLRGDELAALDHREAVDV